MLEIFKSLISLKKHINNTGIFNGCSCTIDYNPRCIKYSRLCLVQNFLIWWGKCAYTTHGREDTLNRGGKISFHATLNKKELLRPLNFNVYFKQSTNLPLPLPLTILYTLI